MGKLRFYIAMLAAKFSVFALKLLRRNASYLPGVIALKICKDFLGYLTMPKTVIAVTGTNGKTTVSNLLTTILRDNGYSVTNNDLGSNVQAGIATILLQDSTLSGKSTKDIAVLEVDERSSLLIYPYVKPNYLVCNNIMRDSLKRNAHTEFISYVINKAIPAETKLILNGDDLICSSLGSAENEKIFLGLDTPHEDNAQAQYVQDIVYCPQCGKKLDAEYIRYNHIGRMFCTECDFRSPLPNFLVTEVDTVNNSFTVKHHGKEEKYNLINDNIINLYNFCSAIAVLTTFGMSYQQISDSFAKAKIVKTRYDYLESGKLKITMQLAKGQNPIACTRGFSYVSSLEGENKAVLIMIDDKGDNTNNSESTCWLYDSDYSYLADPSIGQIIFAGPRCNDHYLRALLAGVEAKKIKITTDPLDGPSLLDLNNTTNLYVLYDPYLLAETNIVKQKLIDMGKEAAE